MSQGNLNRRVCEEGRRPSITPSKEMEVTEMNDSPYPLGAVYGGMLVEAISDPLPGLPEVLFDLQQDRKKNVALGKRKALYSSIEAIRRRYQKIVKDAGEVRRKWEMDVGLLISSRARGTVASIPLSC